MSDLIHISETDLSDFHKDAFGFRPRVGNYKVWWSEDELEAEYEYLSRICNQNMREEEAAEKQALIEFEELIVKTIKLGAHDRKTAIKWLVDAEDLEWNEYDLQYFFWGYNLSYQIQNEWAKALTSNN